MVLKKIKNARTRTHVHVHIYSDEWNKSHHQVNAGPSTTIARQLRQLRAGFLYEKIRDREDFGISNEKVY